MAETFGLTDMTTEILFIESLSTSQQLKFDIGKLS